jgi:hypothetical protein
MRVMRGVEAGSDSGRRGRGHVAVAAWLLGGAAVALVGCQAPPVEPDIHSRDSVRRIPAMVEAAHSQRDDDLAALIRSLDDRDPAVRFFAARALRAITGESFGYVYHRDPEDQTEAINHWRQWYHEQYPGGEPVTPNVEQPQAS